LLFRLLRSRLLLGRDPFSARRLDLRLGSSDTGTSGLRDDVAGEVSRFSNFSKVGLGAGGAAGVAGVTTSGIGYLRLGVNPRGMEWEDADWARFLGASR